MSSHPSQIKLEKRFRKMLNELDEYLENTYGNQYDLHPNRPVRGEAASNLYDGLFSATMNFSMGYGSEHGRGYIVKIDISTLEQVDKEHRSHIEEDAIEHLRLLLERDFPERYLEIKRDGRLYKIVGDFSLGHL
jgi:flagellar capping protein FliD